MAGMSFFRTRSPVAPKRTRASARASIFPPIVPADDQPAKASEFLLREKTGGGPAESAGPPPVLKLFIWQLRGRAEFFGCGGAVAEEFQKRRNHLEQHVGAHLNRAALVLRGLEERGDIGFEHHVPNVGPGCNPIDVNRQWVAVLHSDRGGVDDQV